MPTKLSRYADGIMEAAWLGAVIVVPVFFNVYSSRIFEPDKITLLRSLALLIVAAWIVKLIETGGPQWEQLEAGESWWKTVFKIPLLAPVILMAVMYLIATVFSVTPRVSLWGSYQRLQGTYTTFSYLIVFASMVANLRRREQVERLIGAAIIASLPVSLYGVLQRYKLDPIPWGGDTSARIASNMGNSIFVGAYLIMVFPLTFLRIVESFEAMLTDRGGRLPNFVRSTGYVFILALQSIALYYTGSRGPWLGWGAGLIFIGLGLSLIWRKRWLTVSGVVVAVVTAIFLVTLNIPNGPLESMRTLPGLARLSQLLNTESRTARVRSLIWLGASDLVAPHEPLEFPDGGDDVLNIIRPLIGYGPESMYVAYNPFYPPELTLVERRNASPDRSHNETWDALVITGALGLLVYLALFGSALYYGLKWLGLVQNIRQRNLFLGLYLAGGFLSSLVFVIWQGWPYLGVALPFGMILGVIIYLILVSLFGDYQAPNSTAEKLRAYIILGLVATVIAHYVEINFGIAIVATRTNFWVYAGLLLIVGYILPQHGQFASEKAGSLPLENRQDKSKDDPGASRKAKNKRTKGSSRSSQRKRRSERPSQRGGNLEPLSGWLRSALLSGLVVAILLFTLNYNFITNVSRSESAGKLLWNSLTELSATAGNNSYGVLALLITTWLVGSLLLVSENTYELGDGKETTTTWLRSLGVTLGVSLFLAFIFGLWHSGNLVSVASGQINSMEGVLDQVRRSEAILSLYYVFLFLLLFAMAAVLPDGWPRQRVRLAIASPIVAIVALVAAVSLSVVTNMRVIQADIAFKTADLFSQSQNWQPAIAVYRRAIDLAPNEDYYYLFLGRAYLEHARSLDDPAERDRFIKQAVDDLQKAQQINPLNTDHTANLARLFSLWSSFFEGQQREEYASISENYFDRAVVLSPNNARLWDEWALLYLNMLGKPEEAQPRLAKAIEIDPFYDWSYGLMGDYFMRISGEAGLSEEKRQEYLEQAAEHYEKALEIGGTKGQYSLSYALALAGIQTQLGLYEEAIATYEMALPIAQNHPNLWRIQEALARLYAQVGDMSQALFYAHEARLNAPEDQMERLVELILQLGGQP